MQLLKGLQIYTCNIIFDNNNCANLVSAHLHAVIAPQRPFPRRTMPVFVLLMLPACWVTQTQPLVDSVHPLLGSRFSRKDPFDEALSQMDCSPPRPRFWSGGGRHGARRCANRAAPQLSVRGYTDRDWRRDVVLSLGTHRPQARSRFRTGERRCIIGG